MKNHPVLLTILCSFTMLLSCGKTGSSAAPTITPPPTQDSTSNPTAPAPAPKADSLFAWQKVDSISTSKGIDDIWFTSQTNGVFLGVDRNIYQSLDGGKSWSIVPNSLSAAEMDNLFFVDNTYGFAQGISQLQVTRDGGNTWSLKQLPISPSNSCSSIFFSSRSTGYVGVIGSGLYKTVDTGTTWTKVYPSVSQGSVGYYPYFLNNDQGYVFSGSGPFCKTDDGSVSWQQTATIATVASYIAYNSLQFLDSLTGYYSNPSGVVKTTDGGMTWNSIYPKGSTVSVVKFFTVNTGYYKSDSAIYKTTDGGKTWATSCRLGSDYLLGMNFIDSTHGWACTAKGYVIRLN